LAFGLNLSHGYWTPIAAIVAMKASLDQTTIVAVQRLAGALFGAVAASLLQLIPSVHTDCDWSRSSSECRWWRSSS